MQTRMRKAELIVNALGGALAGALGVIVLDNIAGFLYNRENTKTRQKENEARSQIAGNALNPTTVLVNKISKRFPVPLSERQCNTLDNVIHYALGVVPGAAYGMTLVKDKRVGTGRGFLYGLGLFLLNDEILSVKLGLAAPPRAYPWQSHARGLVSHISLGMVTDLGCRTFQKLLKSPASSGV